MTAYSNESEWETRGGVQWNSKLKASTALYYTYTQSAWAMGHFAWEKNKSDEQHYNTLDFLFFLCSLSLSFALLALLRPLFNSLRCSLHLASTTSSLLFCLLCSGGLLRDHLVNHIQMQVWHELVQRTRPKINALSSVLTRDSLSARANINSGMWSWVRTRDDDWSLRHPMEWIYFSKKRKEKRRRSCKRNAHTEDASEWVRTFLTRHYHCQLLCMRERFNQFSLSLSLFLCILSTGNFSVATASNFFLSLFFDIFFFCAYTSGSLSLLPFLLFSLPPSLSLSSRCRLLTHSWCWKFPLARRIKVLFRCVWANEKKRKKRVREREEK